jgi:hypothetical protein
MDIQTDDTKRKRFLWGVCLAWTPFLFCIPIVIGAFNGIAREKATGFASVAGGLTEFFSTIGLVATLVFEAAAIILLLRTFSGTRPLRALFSVISICCSVFLLMIVALFCLSLFVFHSHH